MSVACRFFAPPASRTTLDAGADLGVLHSEPLVEGIGAVRGDVVDDPYHHSIAVFRLQHVEGRVMNVPDGAGWTGPSRQRQTAGSREPIGYPPAALRLRQ